MKNKAYFSLLGLLLIAASGGGSVGKPSTDTVPAQYSFATGLDQAASLSPTNGEMAMSSSAGGFAQCGPFDPPESVEAPSELRAMIQASSTPAYRPAHADARDLPGIVKLEPETDVGDDEVVTGHCSATRIADNWFVTAAHCISEGYDRIVLKVGSEQLSSQKTQRVEADFAVCHARFKGERNDYSHDLALIHVDAAEMNKLAEVPVVAWGQTHKQFSQQAFASARVGGWGLIEYGGDLADYLQKEELDVREIRDDTIRLASRAGRGPCIGDSGGPLMVDDDGNPVMMGVLSTLGANREGRICAGEYLASYINLATHREWMLSTMATCELNSALCRRT